MSASEDNDAHKEGTLTPYCQVANYLHETYATDDVITEAEANIMIYKQPGTMSAVPYSATLWEKTLKCGRVYNESKLNGVFIEELHQSIRFSMENHWSANKTSTLQNLARYATYLPLQALRRLQ